MTDEHIDVDKRIAECAEMVYRVISDREMLRAEKVREVQRLTERMLWWDRQRERIGSLDAVADLAVAPGGDAA